MLLKVLGSRYQLAVHPISGGCPLAHLWLSSPFTCFCYHSTVFLESLIRHHTIFRSFGRILPADRREESDEIVLVVSHILSGCSTGYRRVSGLPSVSALRSLLMDCETYLMGGNEP
jgi:hypothetical protein